MSSNHRGSLYVSSPSQRKTSSRSSSRRSSSSRITRRNSAAAAYIASVNRFVSALKRSDDLKKRLLDLLVEKGREYFAADKSGFAGNDENIEDMYQDIKVLNKKEFIADMRENQGHADETPDDEVIWGDEASFDDSFRHAIIIDITDIHNPTPVNRPDLLNATNDYVLQWKQVQRLPTTLKPFQIAVHSDGGNEAVFFPIPTLKK